MPFGRCDSVQGSWWAKPLGSSSLGHGYHSDTSVSYSGLGGEVDRDLGRDTRLSPSWVTRGSAAAVPLEWLIKRDQAWEQFEEANLSNVISPGQPPTDIKPTSVSPATASIAATTWKGVRKLAKFEIGCFRQSYKIWGGCAVSISRMLCEDFPG